MALNSALSITNPLLLAGVAGVAALTAGYVAYASSQQKAADASAEAALKAKEQAQELYDLANAIENLDSKTPLTISLEPLSMQQQLDSVNAAIKRTTEGLAELNIHREGCPRGASGSTPAENLRFCCLSGEWRPALPEAGETCPRQVWKPGNPRPDTSCSGDGPRSGP